MVMTIGAAYVALRARGPLVLALPAVALVVVAQGSIGLRLPERLLERESASSPTVEALVSLGEELERTAPSVTVVADRCLGTRARFLIGRPTLIAAEPWQVPFRNLLPAAEQAAAVVSGGLQGREAAERLGVGYVVVDPSCTPAPAPGLGGSRVLAQPELVVIRLPRT
jgi:hypothetical protein